MKAILIGYEPTQADTLREKYSQLKRDGHEASIVAFDLELEWRLVDADVPFVSCLEYRRGDRLKNLEYSEQLVNDVRSVGFSGIRYRSVALDTLFCFSLQVYIEKWFYFAEVYDEMLERDKPDKVYVCAPFFSPPVDKDTYLYYENEAPVLCLKYLCETRGVPCERVGEPSMRSLPKDSGKRSSMLTFGLKTLNWLMGFMSRKNDIRLLASEYWRHIGPLFSELPNSSLTLYDRSEFRQIPLSKIFRHRMRFMHGPDTLSEKALRRVAEEEKLVRKAWASRREDVLRAHSKYRSSDMSTVIVEALDNVIEHQLHGVLLEVEKIYSLLEKVRPHAVILRASVSAQPHFPALAQAARDLGIPSIELQHGLEIFAKGSISRFHAAEYIGLYGEIIRREMELHTPPGPKLSVIGSLYFDSSCGVQNPATPNGGTDLLCVAPDVSLSTVYDTYDAYEYFSATALAARSSGMKARIKLRGSRRQPFYHEALRKAFNGAEYSIIQEGSIADACRGVRLAVSCYSTAVLELLRCGMPTVIAAPSPLEYHFVSFHFAPYEKDGALKIAQSPDELSKTVATISGQSPVRESLKRDAARFISINYAFDGSAAKRLAELIVETIRHSALSVRRVIL